MNPILRIIALTPAGKTLAESLQLKLFDSKFDVEISYKPKPFKESVQTMFENGEKLVFICSTGIVIRTLAPVLQDKYKDPPVIVLDEAGQFVVPLLSGHEGGANDLADQVAKVLGAQLVLTSANSYLQPVYTVGMGCERDCPQESLQSLLEQCLQESGLHLDQIDSINSIDIKADETGLIDLAKACKKPFHTFNTQELSTMEHLLSVKSVYVFKTVGVYGVAEAAALFAAQSITGSEAIKGLKNDLEINSANNNADQPELILNKQKNTQATCAIARSYRKKLNV